MSLAPPLGFTNEAGKTARHRKEIEMSATEKMTKAANFTITFEVDQTPEEVFAAINQVRGWWSGKIEGVTDQPGASFSYQHEDMHSSLQTITEMVPGKRIVWHVSNSRLSFIKDPSEWNDTDVVFDISRKADKTECRFTHVGLTPSIECFGACSGGWTFYINDSLRSFITTGRGDPSIER